MGKLESYVNLKAAKLLKKLGFNWLCGSLYGLDVRYKGQSIDEDEEYSLKAAGKGKEIKYVDGGLVYDFNNTNDDSFGGYSRPTLDIARKWLRDVKNIEIEIHCNLTKFAPKKYTAHIYDGVDVIYDVVTKPYKGYTKLQEFDTYEKALAAAIEKSLNILKKK